MSQTAPGWYEDGSGSLRWWDGAAWTEHFASVAPQPAPASAPRKGMRWWGWTLLATGVLALVAAGVGTVVWALGLHAESIAQAKDAVRTYDLAWRDVDCELLAEATTADLREFWGYDDCATFESDAESFDERSRGYTTTFGDATFKADVVTIVTTERYSGDDGATYTDRVTYTVVEEDGAWRIDTIDYDDADAVDSQHA